MLGGSFDLFPEVIRFHLYRTGCENFYNFNVWMGVYSSKKSLSFFGPVGKKGKMFSEPRASLNQSILYKYIYKCTSSFLIAVASRSRYFPMTSHLTFLSTLPSTHLTSKHNEENIYSIFIIRGLLTFWTLVLSISINGCVTTHNNNSSFHQAGSITRYNRKLLAVSIR